MTRKVFIARLQAKDPCIGWLPSIANALEPDLREAPAHALKGDRLWVAEGRDPRDIVLELEGRRVLNVTVDHHMHGWRRWQAKPKSITPATGTFGKPV